MTSPPLPPIGPTAVIDTRQDIELAEGVTIHLLPAGPVPRALAYGVDLCIRVGIYYVLSMVFAFSTMILGDASMGLMLITFFLMEWFYNVFFEMSSRGATPGQRMMGLRVVSETGAAPTIGQSMLRNLVRTADFLPVGYALGAVVMLSTKRFQRLGDLAARTLVVHQDKVDGEAQRRPMQPISVRSEPPPAEPPAIPLNPGEARAILEFEARLTSWTPERQAEIAAHATPLLQGSASPVKPIRALARWLQNPQAVASPEARWQKFDDWLSQLETKPKKVKNMPPPPAPPWAEMPALFRQVCADLALARQRCLSPLTVERLNNLCLRGCQHLYGGQGAMRAGLWRFFGETFPRAVRTEWRIVALCHFLFWFPFLTLLFFGDRDPRWFESTLGADGMQSLHQMYGDREAVAGARDSLGENFAMFGHYIWNNVGICFRTFAGGLLLGVGALLITLFNGIQIGAAAGYVTHAADPVAFWTFVAGHAAFELTGIILSGAAGLRMGLAIIAPGAMTRREALGAAAERAFPILIGAAMLVVAAAFIEGFWSPLRFPPLVKYAFGIILWLLTAVYFIFSGRTRSLP